MTYLEKLRAVQEKNNSWLCVSLDPDPQRLRVDALKWDEPILPFNKAIIDATADLICAFKPNLGFYLMWGAAGIIALERTIAYIPGHIPVILDCKTGDIGHTQAAWATGLFDQWSVDAITVNPFVGEEAVLPMIGDRPDKAIYILARTSNPGAMQFQGDLAAGKDRVLARLADDPHRRLVEDTVEEMGWWDPDSGEEFVFWKAYSGRKPFSTREFFVLSRLAPSLNLSIEADELPFAVKPDDKVSVRDVIALFRQTYEGTDLDMTRNLVAQRRRSEEVSKSAVASPWMSYDMMSLLNTLKPETVVRQRDGDRGGVAQVPGLLGQPSTPQPRTGQWPQSDRHCRNRSVP